MLFESVPGSHLVLAPDAPRFTIVAASEAYLRMTMTKREEILGRGVFEVFPENPAEPGADDLHSARGSMERALRTGAPDALAALRYAIPGPDGSFEERYWSPLNTPIFDPQGRIAWLLHSAEDITDLVRLERHDREQVDLVAQLRARAGEMEGEIHRRAQHLQQVNQRLREANERLEAMGAALDTAALVLALNPEGAILEANERFLRLAGLPREALVGKAHRALLRGVDTAEEELWHAVRAGHPWRGELLYRGADGEGVWVDSTFVPFTDAEGALTQILAIASDITARKRAEARLREQESLARLGELAAVVAHEVKNPIAGVSGALQVLAARMAPESREARLLADLQGRLNRLTETVQDLLAFAQPRASAPQRVALVPLLEECSRILARNRKFRGVQVLLSGESPQVCADPEQLEEALVHLLRNAAQAMGGQGTIRVGVQPEGTGWSIAIADEGPGVPPEDQERVFDLFFSTRTYGAGLGLAVVKRNVEAVGGRIALSSPPGEGATFSLWLPG